MQHIKQWPARSRWVALILFGSFIAPSIFAAEAKLIAKPKQSEITQPSIKVVYQFSDGIEQATMGLTNTTNHVDAEPSVQIVVVAYGHGLDFLLQGAKDSRGESFANRIADLTLAGVEFRVCRITLEKRGIHLSSINHDVKVVPSGVAEITRLQAREGYAYIKP